VRGVPFRACSSFPVSSSLEGGLVEVSQPKSGGQDFAGGMGSARRLLQAVGDPELAGHLLSPRMQERRLLRQPQGAQQP
jgi:hypothetical protein